MGLFDIFSNNNMNTKKLDISLAHIKEVGLVKAQIEKNADAISSLIFLAQDKEEFLDQLKNVYITIKYFNPIVSPLIKDLDEQIFNKTLDLKLSFSSRMNTEITIRRQLKELQELVHTRELKS